MCVHCALQQAAGLLREDRASEDILEPGDKVGASGDLIIIRKLGKGGMGVVYEALQKSLNRSVALKVISFTGFDDEDREARFREEVRLLARVNHPNVLTVYESGEQKGQLYFTMRLAKGGSLSQRLSVMQLPNPTNTRLTQKDIDKCKASIATLVMKLALAVHRVHQAGVLHRDLKPGNIFFDESEEALVADFGLAKSIDAFEPLTPFGVAVGTPAYMAPEQLVSANDITTSADVYALGVILYQLLTGRLPFIAGSQEELFQKILSDRPANPSAINPLVDAEQEAICLKCLSKEPGNRYASAKELADDLERYLNNALVHALDYSRGQKIMKVCRRHPKLCVISVGVASFAVVGLATVLLQWQAALRERKIADDVTTFFVKSLSPQGLSPKNSPVRVVDLLDRASASIATTFKQSVSGSSPDLSRELQVRRSIARAYWSLGRYLDAKPHLERATKISERLSGSNSIEALDSLYEYARLLRDLNLYKESATVLRTVLAGRRSRLGENDPETLNTQRRLATTLMDLAQFSEAGDLLEKTLARQKMTLSPRHEDVFDTRDSLVTLLWRRGFPEDAVRSQQELINESLSVFGANSQWVQHASNSLALYLMEVNHYSEAEPLVLAKVERARSLFGEDHPSFLSARMELAVLWYREGKQTNGAPQKELWNRAANSFRETLEKQVSLLGSNHVDSIITIGNYANFLDAVGEHQKAQEMYRTQLDLARRSLGSVHYHTRDTIFNLARSLGRGTNNLPEVEVLRREVLSSCITSFGTNNPKTLEAMIDLGQTLLTRGKLDEAENTFLRASDLAEANLLFSPKERFQARNGLAEAFEKEGRFVDAAKELTQAVTRMRNENGNAGGKITPKELNQAKIRLANLMLRAQPSGK